MSIAVTLKKKQITEDNSAQFFGIEKAKTGREMIRNKAHSAR